MNGIASKDRVERLSLLHRARIGARRAVPRSLPDFLVIGAQRSGTTTLYDYLASQPGVRRPVRKEIHYFAAHYGRGLSWYRAHFPIALRADRRWLTFECTPYYLLHPLVPMRVKSDLPDVKLVVLLRDPVDRFLSQYRMNVERGIEVRPLAAVVAAERAQGHAEIEAGSNSPEHRNFSYLARGRYVEQLQRWFAQFPRASFHLIDFDDLVEQPRPTLEQACDFLGLTAPTMDAALHSGYRTGRSAAGPAVEGLRAYYETYDKQLSELVERTFRWQE